MSYQKWASYAIGMCIVALCIILVASWLGLHTPRQRENRALSQLIESVGGQCSVDSDGSVIRVDLTGCRMPVAQQEQLMTLHAAKRIQHLSFCGINLSGVTPRAFRNLTEVTILDLSDTAVNRDQLRMLSHIRGLVALYLGDNKQIEDMKWLSDCKWRIRVLTLRATRVSDADISIIASQCPELTHLDLSETNVGDACLPHLGGMQYLEHVNLHDTRATVDGVRNAALGGRLNVTMQSPNWSEF